jgi:hypothetical protein
VSCAVVALVDAECHDHVLELHFFTIYYKYQLERVKNVRCVEDACVLFVFDISAGRPD